MAASVSVEYDEAQEAQKEVLGMKMIKLVYVHDELHEIYRNMSTDGRWEELASYLGLSQADVDTYRSRLAGHPNILPAETFLRQYYKEKQCTVKDFLRALLMMGQRDPCTVELAGSLWNAAVYQNSPYYRRLCNR